MRIFIALLALFALSIIDKNTAAGEEIGHARLLCSDCHTMHYSVSGEIPPGAGPGGPFVDLLLTQTTNQLCLSCHDGSDPSAPNVDNALGYAPAAGYFSPGGSVIEGNRHSLGSSDDPPGHTGGSWSEILTCASCHEPHENTNYRNLVENPGEGKTVRVTTMSGPVYDGLSTVQEIAVEPVTVRYSEDNIRYRRSDMGSDQYGLAEWCGGCHGDFHGTGGSPNMGGGPAGDTGAGREWLRHPTRDVMMSEAAANDHLGTDNWFTPLASRVPVVSPSTIPGTVNDSDNEVFCGSCHKAHGSSHPDMLIFDRDRTSSPGDGSRMAETCTQCHFGVDYLTSAHGDEQEGVERVITVPSTIGECSQCHYMHASINEEPTGNPNIYTLYTDHRNSLCFDPTSQSGCHQEVPFGYPAQETDRIPEGFSHAGYFEYGSGGVKISGVTNRKRWPGMLTYTDSRTFGNGKFYSPHRNDPDMPLRDADGMGLCVNCHSPHGTDNPFDMLIASYQSIGGAEEVGPPVNYDLCFQCHGPNGPIGMDEENRRIADFYDSRINPDNQAGHQIRLSSQSALSWPSHVEKGDKLPCYDCHNSHGSAGNDGIQPNGFLISDQRSGWNGLTDTLNDPEQTRRFCFGCHIPADGIPGSQSVGGIVMNAIPNRRQHRSDDTTSCYECHGSDYSSPDAYNVHHPRIGGHGIGEFIEEREQW